MKKIVKKGFYPVILGASLAATLVGCGKGEKLTTEEITNEKITTEEKTTEANVPEDVELGISDKEYNKNELSKMVEKTYTEYRQFYDALSISKEEVAIMVDVLNGYYDGYSEDQIDDALANINRILSSDNLKQLLDNVNTRKYEGDAPIAVSSDIVDKMTVLPFPNISEFSLTLNSEDLEIIANYEQLRSKLVNEIISTGTYSDSIVKEINRAVIEQEVKGYISGSYSGVAAQSKLCGLCQLVNPTTPVITDSTGKEYQLSSKGYVNEEGYIESDEEAKYLTLIESGERVPDEILSKLKNVIFIKYDNKSHELEESIKSNASYATETNEVSEELNKKIAQKSYEQYKDYYDYISASEQDVSIMVDVINGDVSNYSKEAIDNANDLAFEILFPKKMKNAIKDYNDNKEVSFSSSDANIPKISAMLMINDEFKANLIAYENLRDEIAHELSNNGSYSDGMVQKINNAVIDQETINFDEYVDYLESSVNNEGSMSILIAADLQQCNLCVSVNPNVSFIKGNNDDYEYQISPRKDKNERGYIEQEVVDKYNELKKAGKEIPDDLLEEYTIIQMELVPAKYEQQYNEWKNLLLIKAGYTDPSILSFYEQKKVLLSLLKERLFYKEMENDLSENSVFKGYALTFTA